MVVLGVDPGLAHTGWAVLETRGSVCRCRAYGCIDTASKDPLHVRLGVIYKEIAVVIERYTPCDVAVEEVFFGQNVSSAISVAHARGVVLALAATCGLQVGEYTPMQIKLALVGHGKADKQQVAYMVKRICALDHIPTPDHSADALAAAICHAHTMRGTVGLR